MSLRSALYALTALALTSQFSMAAPVIHRAFEPARASLDISLKEQSLTLFLNLDAEAIAALAQGKPTSKLVESLSAHRSLFIPESSADCSIEDSQFTEQSADTPESSQAAELNGYLAYTCKKPEGLNTIKVMLRDALPGLKEISAWVVTDIWQSKQVLRSGEQQVKVRE